MCGNDSKELSRLDSQKVFNRGIKVFGNGGKRMTERITGSATGSQDNARAERRLRKPSPFYPEAFETPCRLRRPLGCLLPPT